MPSYSICLDEELGSNGNTKERGRPDWYNFQLNGMWSFLVPSVLFNPFIAVSPERLTK